MASTYQTPPNGALPSQGYTVPNADPVQDQSIYQPPQYNTATSIQNSTGSPVRYKITRRSFHSRYECRPELYFDRPATYTLKLSDGSKNKPFLSFAAKGMPMGECYFPNVRKTSRKDANSFRIGLGNPSDMQWTELIHHVKDEYGWSFTFNLPSTGQPVPLTWVKDNKVAVDGRRASSLSDNNFKLRDPNGQVMAVFTSHSLSLSSSTAGTVQINVDFGPGFEHAVVMTLLCIYEYKKRYENNSSSSSNAGTACIVGAAGAAGGDGGAAASGGGGGSSC
ncbi:hypothetical protein FIE12Z_10419 [Fusarium flagelliforme]|uniref:Uncharacterized protein n=1 Tax=Fusarium flagelliforme TaxID=2675880 RepID=A0A395MBT6_9HYPO|nr:hypothetical protein FIE12Z_10419 [Fusarium flagelliforme]